MDPSEHRSWTRRVFEAAGGSAPRVGLAIFAVVSGAFAAQELALGRFAGIDEDPTLVSDMRLVLTHVAVVAYMIAASVYYEQSRDATLRELRADFGERVRVTTGLRGAALAGALLLGVTLAVLLSVTLSPGPTSYAPDTWSPETAWHRVFALLIGATTSRLFFSILVESGRISDEALELPEVDLLAPVRLAPFVRIGLQGALLAIGAFSVYALFLIDSGYLPLVGGSLVLTALVAGTALFLPLRGVRVRVREQKQRELLWCRERIRSARARLVAGEPAGDLEELLAWEARVEGIAEWPIDSSTWGRFGLYLLIPLGSWAGAAMVERVIDALLD